MMEEKKKKTGRTATAPDGVSTAGASGNENSAAHPKGELTAAGHAAPAAKNASPVNDVAELAPELRELAERMLVEGATFEDVHDALNGRGVPVTLQAVQNLYRGDLDLQRRRIQFQVERADALRQALANPESADAQLAYAAMLTGLQSLERRHAGFSLKDAVRGTLERRTVLLRQRLLKMQIAREEEEKRFRKTRLHAEFLKLRMTKTKLAQLERELQKQENQSTLGRTAMEKIQEIYGLLQIPVIPRDLEAAQEEKLMTGDE